jgi:hypothetical protein
MAAGHAGQATSGHRAVILRAMRIRLQSEYSATLELVSVLTWRVASGYAAHRPVARGGQLGTSAMHEGIASAQVVRERCQWLGSSQ